MGEAGKRLFECLFVSISWLSQTQWDTADIPHIRSIKKTFTWIRKPRDDYSKFLFMSKTLSTALGCQPENVNFWFSFSPKIAIRTYQTLFVFSKKRITPSDASSKPKSARHRDALRCGRELPFFYDVTYVRTCKSQLANADVQTPISMTSRT
jgi:hypothetical protein